MSYRDHPGICEAEPPIPADIRYMLTYGKADWPEARDLMRDRIAWEQRHALELERRSYAAGVP